MTDVLPFCSDAVITRKPPPATSAPMRGELTPSALVPLARLHTSRRAVADTSVPLHASPPSKVGSLPEERRVTDGTDDATGTLEPRQGEGCCAEGFAELGSPEVDV